MPLPLIYHKGVVIYSLILLYLSNESQSTLKFTQCQINAGFLWTLVLVRGHLYVCFKKNTNMKFHTSDVVVRSSGCVMYIKGWLSHMALIQVSLFIYFIFICIPTQRSESFSSLAYSQYGFIHQKTNVILTQTLFNIALNYWLSIFVKC